MQQRPNVDAPESVGALETFYFFLKIISKDSYGFLLSLRVLIIVCDEKIVVVLSIRLSSHWDSGIRFRCYCDEKGRTGGSEPQTWGR